MLQHDRHLQYVLTQNASYEPNFPWMEDTVAPGWECSLMIEHIPTIHKPLG